MADVMSNLTSRPLLSQIISGDAWTQAFGLEFCRTWSPCSDAFHCWLKEAGSLLPTSRLGLGGSLLQPSQPSGPLVVEAVWLNADVWHPLSARISTLRLLSASLGHFPPFSLSPFSPLAALHSSSFSCQVLPGPGLRGWHCAVHAEAFFDAAETYCPGIL